MQTHSSQFIFLGRSAQVLEKYRRELSHFSIHIANWPSESSGMDQIMSVHESISGIFIDVDAPNDFESLFEVTKNITAVPIIVIATSEILNFDRFKELNSTIRVLKKPLLGGELLQETKNVIQQEQIVVHTLRKERLALIRQVLRGLSHELGNMIFRMLGKADLGVLALDDGNVEKASEYLSGVMNAAEQARTLVRNLQTFAKSKPQPTLGKVSQCLTEALKQNDSLLQSNKITVESDLQFLSEEKEFAFDRNSLTQIFYHLIENSALAMPNGGKLKILGHKVSSSATEANQTHLIRLSFEDKGVGMPKDTLKRAFDFGFSTRRDSASGMGLSIVRELLLSNGGSLDLKSEEGQGTTAIVELRMSLDPADRS